MPPAGAVCVPAGAFNHLSEEPMMDADSGKKRDRRYESWRVVKVHMPKSLVAALAMYVKMVEAPNAETVDVEAEWKRPYRGAHDIDWTIRTALVEFLLRRVGQPTPTPVAGQPLSVCKMAVERLWGDETVSTWLDAHLEAMRKAFKETSDRHAADRACKESVAAWFKAQREKTEAADRVRLAERMEKASTQSAALAMLLDALPEGEKLAEAAICNLLSTEKIVDSMNLSDDEVAELDRFTWKKLAGE